jgi:hypothetical protein
VNFPLVDGVPAYACASQLLLQFCQGGRGFLGETDEIAGVPIEFGDLAGVSSDSSAVPTTVTEAG